MSNKKILYITPVLLPGSSAASKRILANAKLLKLLNYDVYVYSGLNISKQLVQDGVKIIPSGIDIEETRGVKKLLGYRKSVLHFINTLNSQDLSDIKAIVVYSGYSFYLFPLLKWAKQHKIPLVFDAVEWYTPAKKMHWLFKPYFWNTEFAMRYFIPNTKNVIAISSYLGKYYTDRNCNTVIIPPLYYEITSSEQLNNCNYLRLSYTGSPGKKDNLDQILRAILELKDKDLSKEIKLEIAGINEVQLLSYPAFKEKSITVLPDNFIAHGYVTMKSAQEITAHSDFSILFRKNDKTNTAGFPTKAVESLSLGTPIFLNYSSDLHIYLQNYKNSIVVKDFKVKTLKKALIKMVEIDGTELQMMRQDALNTAQSNFLFSSKTNLMSNFLRNIIT